MSWFRRGGPELPPLVEAPRIADLPEAVLQSGAKYLGTTLGGERVTARGLGSRGSARLVLSDQALDVVRMAGPFRIPLTALRGARDDEGQLVVSWQHGEHVLETTLQLSVDKTAPPGSSAAKQRTWVRKIGKLSRKHQ